MEREEQGTTEMGSPDGSEPAARSLRRAERLALDDAHLSWLAEANGCVAQWTVSDPDLVLFVRPIANAHMVGVELVDADGKSYAQAVRCG